MSDIIVVTNGLFKKKENLDFELKSPFLMLKSRGTDRSYIQNMYLQQWLAYDAMTRQNVTNVLGIPNLFTT